MMADHAPLAPSAAARWVVCPGSVRLEAEAPLPVIEDHAKAAAWGDAAHWFAASILTLDASVNFLNQKAPNGVIADDEMIEAVQMYVDDVRGLLDAGQIPAVEGLIKIPSVHADNWGSPDCWIFNPAAMRGGILRLWDFKGGHRFVEAFENWQLIDYAIGILDLICAEHEFDRANITVEMTVVQPRSFHPAGPIRRWLVNAPDLDDYQLRLLGAAANALSDTPGFAASPECRDCKGRHRCATLHAAAQAAMDISTRSTSVDLDAAALGLELRSMRRAAELLAAKITGLEAVAETRLRTGERIPHFHLAQNQSREQWAMDAATVLATGDALGVKLAKEPAPITPGQARKALKAAGMGEALLDGFTERPPGAMKLAEINDTLARKVFGA